VRLGGSCKAGELRKFLTRVINTRGRRGAGGNDHRWPVGARRCALDLYAKEGVHTHTHTHRERARESTAASNGRRHQGPATSIDLARAVTGGFE
jgi:hypothetical protein